MSERADLRLPWRADGVFVLNCDGYPIADADTKREVAFITLAVNHHDALVDALRAMVDRWEPDTSGKDRDMRETARALMTKIGGEG